MNMILITWIAIGSALGGVARFLLGSFITLRTGDAFPWGTLAVNVIGSFVIGFFATLTAPDGRYPLGSNGRHFFMTGVLGGFTTFSAFSWQTLVLAREGEIARAGGYALSSMFFCLGAVWLGQLAAQALARS